MLLIRDKVIVYQVRAIGLRDQIDVKKRNLLQINNRTENYYGSKNIKSGWLN